MKRTILLLIITLITAVNASSQVIVEDIFTTRHLVFKGVPLDGEIEAFKTSLESKGFRQAEDLSVMYGTFTGVNCKIVIGTTPNTNRVRSVLVCYDGYPDWKKLRQRYDILSEALALKYGTDCVSKKEFRSPYREGDLMEAKAFKNGKADWTTTYRTEKGDITLFVKDMTGGYLGLYLLYEDMENTDIEIEELAEEL